MDKPPPGPCLSIYQHIVSRLAGGETLDVIRREVFRDFPATPDHAKPRYHCQDCQDSGLVYVWPVKGPVLRAAAAGEGRRPCRATMVPCSCREGEQFFNGTEKTACWTNQDVRYKPDRYCRCRNGDTSSDAGWQEYVEWVEWKRRQKPANYEARFDDF